jgi:PAS domain-containing protein
VAVGDREGLFAFFDAGSVGMAVVDEKGRIVWANKTLGRIMDRCLKSIQGRRLSRFLGETPSDGAAGSQRDDLCGLPGMPREGTILRKGGGRVPVHLSAGFLCAADGHAYSVVCVTDLTVHGENKEVLKRRAFQQGIISEIGLFALSSGDIPGLMRKTVRLMASILDVEMAEVMRLNPDGTLRLEAGVGTADPQGTIYSPPDGPGLSMTSFVQSARGPVVIGDYATEDRFTVPEMFLRAGCKAAWPWSSTAATRSTASSGRTPEENAFSPRTTSIFCNRWPMCSPRP